MGESERQIKIGRKGRGKGWERKGEDRGKEKGKAGKKGRSPPR